MALINKLKAIADAIRSKTNKTEEMTLERMASEVEELKVGELDFEGVFDQEQADKINQFYKDGIEYAKRLIEIAPTVSNWDYYFTNVDPSSINKCLFIPIIENYTWVNPTFMFQFTDVEYVPYMKVSKTINFMFYYCGRLKSVTLENVSKGNNYNSVFANCINVEKIHLISSVSDAYAFANTFYNCYKLKNLQINGYAKNNLSLAQSPKLSTESIKYIIWHALNGNNTLDFENQGATSRTLTLSATPYASWETWKLTKPSVEDCEFLGIDETEITKYGELTWEDIALNVKLITIAK